MSANQLAEHLEEMVKRTISDLTSEFPLMPEGPAFIKYDDFRTAYEVLKRHTMAFTDFARDRTFEALVANSRAFCVIRAILGMTPPEWGELVREEYSFHIPQGAARTLDRKCREDIEYVRRMEQRHRTALARREQPRKGHQNPAPPITLQRIDAMLKAAVYYISQGAPNELNGTVHRMAKFDTSQGMESVQYAAKENIPKDSRVWSSP